MLHIYCSWKPVPVSLGTFPDRFWPRGTTTTFAYHRFSNPLSFTFLRSLYAELSSPTLLASFHWQKWILQRILQRILAIVDCKLLWILNFSKQGKKMIKFHSEFDEYRRIQISLINRCERTITVWTFFFVKHTSCFFGSHDCGFSIVRWRARRIKFTVGMR